MPIELSIVVPVFNEADNVLPLSREVAQALRQQSLAYELVFVDDASTDATWAKIHEAHQLDPRVRGLRHTRNSGQSAALWTGIQATTAPIIGTLDGDLQNDPADLIPMLGHLRHVDFVSGMRLQRQDHFLRRISSAFAYAMRKAILGAGARDSGCGIRVFKRAVLNGLFPFDGFHRFLPVLIQESALHTLEVPVRHRPRVAGVSKYGIRNRLWRGFYDLIGVGWYQKRRLPPVASDPLTPETAVATSNSLQKTS